MLAQRSNVMKEGFSPKKLFPLNLLLLIFLIVVFLLGVMFPWSSESYLTAQKVSVLKEQFSSRIKTLYYQMLDVENPSAKEVIFLAQVLTNKSLWNLSNNLLSKKMIREKLGASLINDYELIVLNNKIGFFYESQSVEKKKILKHDVQQQLLKISMLNLDFPNSLLQKLAEACGAFELYPLSSVFYERLAQNNLSKRSYWYALAGELAIQSGDDDKAVNMYKKALDSARSVPQLQRYTQSWLSALNRANQLPLLEEFLNSVKSQPDQYPNSLGIIARESAKFGYPLVATYLFHYLAKTSPMELQQGWYEKASYWSAVSGNNDDAISFLLKAKEKSVSESGQWLIKQRLVDLYIKDNNTDKALDLVLESMKNFPNDVRLINKAVDISLKGGQLNTARNINLSYLNKMPNSVSGLIRQAKIELADEKYNQAINYVKRAVKEDFDNLTSHKLWADIEASRENYTFAIDKWLWIYDRDDSGEHRQRLISVAQADIEGKGLGVLQKLASTSELPRQAVYDVFYYLVNSGGKKQAIHFLQTYLSSHKADKALHITLAKWLSSQKKYSASLTVWQRVDQHFGASKASSLSQFELLWLLNRKKSAYKLWVKNKKSWGKNVSTQYLLIMAEIAWQYKYTKSALSYYSVLLNRRYKRSVRTRELQYLRVSNLQEKLGRKAQALTSLSKGISKTRSRKLLLRGLQLSFDSYDDINFEHFLSLANRYRTNIKKSSRYWILLGAYDQRYGRLNSALGYYKRALAINPNAKDAWIGVNAIKKAGV